MPPKSRPHARQEFSPKSVPDRLGSRFSRTSGIRKRIAYHTPSLKRVEKQGPLEDASGHASFGFVDGRENAAAHRRLNYRPIARSGVGVHKAAVVGAGNVFWKVHRVERGIER